MTSTTTTTSTPRVQMATLIIQELAASDVNTVSKLSGVAVATLNNWIMMRTMNPRLPGLLSVAEALGLEIHFKYRGKARQQLRRVA